MNSNSLLLFLVGFLLAASSAVSVPKDSLAETFRNPVLYEDYSDNDVSVGPDGAINILLLDV